MGRMNNDPVRRGILGGGVVGGYGVLMNPVSQAIGGGALALAIVPVLVAGWFAGLWMGLVVGLLAAPMGGLILAAHDAIGAGGSLVDVVVPSMLALGLVGVVVGRLRDVSRRAGVQAVMLMAESRRRQEAEAETRAAQEDERRRIAEDVHDDVIQVMTAVAFRLGILRRRLQEPAQLAGADGDQATGRTA